MTTPTHRFHQTARMRVPPPDHTFSPLSSTYHRGETTGPQTDDSSYYEWGLPASSHEPPPLVNLSWIGVFIDHIIEHSITISSGMYRRHEVYEWIMTLQHIMLYLRQSDAYFCWCLNRVTTQLWGCMGVMAVLVAVCMWLLYYICG